MDDVRTGTIAAEPGPAHLPIETDPGPALNLWREFEPAREGPEYLFLDEIQAAKDWQTWLKRQVDFDKSRRIAVTGSATPLLTAAQDHFTQGNRAPFTYLNGSQGRA